MKAIILKSTEWEAGLLGIVCSKLSEEYNRPTCLFSQSDDILTGSCRSVNGVNVHSLMCSMSDILDKFGGHTMAAGVTLNDKYFDEFCSKFNDYVDKNLIKEEFNADMPVLYGGSVKPSNSKEILALNEVDGVLIGGASLKAEDYIAIAQSR